MKSCLLFLCVLLSSALTGCQTPLTPTQPPAADTAVPTVSLPAPLPATSTQLPSPTSSSTPVMTEEEPTATPDAIGTVLASSRSRVLTPSISPDGQWRAEVVVYDCVQVGETDENAYEQLKMTHLSDGAETIADTQLRYCEGLGAFGLEGLFWSPNSRYFYYTNAIEGSPDGLCSYWGRPLLSWEVSTRQQAYLGDGPRSPDGDKIAAWRDQELVVWDVNTGEIGQVSMATSGQVPGPIAWSPDSRAVVYLRTVDYCIPRGKSYIGHIDVPTLQHTILLESEDPRFEDLQWVTSDRLKLVDEEGKSWQFHLDTMILEPN